MTAEELFEANLRWAAGIARNVARQLPPSFETADIEQEARIEHWRQCQKYDPSRGVPYQGFAYRAVRGACLMFARRRHWTAAVMEEIDSSQVDDAELPDELAIAHQQEQRPSDTVVSMRQAMDRLEDADRYLVRTVHLDGLDISAFAELWRMSRTEAGRRLRCALNRLKKDMECSAAR